MIDAFVDAVLALARSFAALFIPPWVWFGALLIGAILIIEFG